MKYTLVMDTRVNTHAENIHYRRKQVRPDASLKHRLYTTDRRHGTILRPAYDYQVLLGDRVTYETLTINHLINDFTFNTS